MIGLGCMRLSTAPARAAARGIEVIHAALDAGATLLDTADAYCLDEADTGHNERLIAQALRTWPGDRAAVTVATKGGLWRPGGRWVPDGRATHLRAACDASCAALGVAAVDLYQLHAVDPRVSLETSVRALKALQAGGQIRRIGLCNVTVTQIEAARRIADIAAVQVSLSLLEAGNLHNGVAEYCIEHGIQLIAYRPLGGDRTARLAREPVLREIASAHGVTAPEVALGWLLDLHSGILPIPGATRVETARSLARVRALRLTEADRERFDARYPAGRLLRVPRKARMPRADATGDVVLVMGMPAAGKSSVARAFVERGYARLNRDESGGRLADLVEHLDAGLRTGNRRWVLDNTYAARADRNQIIECAWRHGVPVRCVWLKTDVADAQINATSRLIAAHGRLPMPEELRALGRADHRYFGPDAQFRWERQLEPPVAGEGFAHIEERTFARVWPPDFEGRAVLLEYDDVLCACARDGSPALDPDAQELLPGTRDTLRRHAADGWHVCAHAWRPQLARGETSSDAVRACFERARELLGIDIDIAWCPHAAGPPVCWCRKPLPGLVLEAVFRHKLALARCTMVGRSAADRTMAQRLGVSARDADEFFQRGAEA